MQFGKLKLNLYTLNGPSKNLYILLTCFDLGILPHKLKVRERARRSVKAVAPLPRSFSLARRVVKNTDVVGFSPPPLSCLVVSGTRYCLLCSSLLSLSLFLVSAERSHHERETVQTGLASFLSSLRASVSFSSVAR